MEMGVTIVTIVVERFLAILVIKSWRAKTAFPRLRGRSCVSILGTSWAILFHKAIPLTGEKLLVNRFREFVTIQLPLSLAPSLDL